MRWVECDELVTIVIEQQDKQYRKEDKAIAEETPKLSWKFWDEKEKKK